MKTMKLEIGGMHCQSCQALITDILQDEGIKVNSFDVDLKKQKGNLKLETTKTSDEVCVLIKSAGKYSVKNCK